MFFLFNHFCKQLRIDEAIWNDTPPGHGKQRGDLTERSGKRMCDDEVAARSDTLSANDFAKTIGKKSHKIRELIVEDIK